MPIPKDDQLIFLIPIQVFPILIIYDLLKAMVHYNLVLQLIYLKYLKTLSIFPNYLHFIIMIIVILDFFLKAIIH